MFEDIYRKVSEGGIEECGGTGIVYEHIKTGAKVFTLKNSDPNKVFLICFRTTPGDSTGVAHIMEHSVLCGSEKFPLKDPFVELAKGSLNTFLNALTYPDKTVYPVASCNEKDFMNLMDVYLDAVFHPRVLKEKNIFMQEGWHYEVGGDGELLINGVVYNEMKGAFSSPDAVLERYILNSLYPDTTYGNESGGDPDFIPCLTYEDFLSFHARYYHPSNSYIYLYGDTDMEEKLLWMDENYLGAYEKQAADTEIVLQEPFESPVYTEKPYAVSKGEGTVGKTYLSESFSLGEIRDSLTDLAWETLGFLLLSAPGAPLREELTRAGIGEEIYGGYNSGIRQPYFSITAKNSEKEKTELFKETIRAFMEKTVKEGLDEVSLMASLNFMEFKYREEDFGRIPAGLNYGLSALDAWLYGMPPQIFLTYREEFEKLRGLVGTGYYERLLKETFLDSDFRATVVITPEAMLTEKKEKKLRKKLSDYRKTLSKSELAAVKRNEKKLRAYQDEPESKEAIESLPTLSVSDIGREAEKVMAVKRDGIIFSDIPTKGIAYMRLVYDLSDFSEEELQFVSFLASLYGEMDTERHTFKELSDLMLLKTGGLYFTTNAYVLAPEGEAFKPALTVEIRTLKENIGEGIRLALEITGGTSLLDSDRIQDKLFEARSRMQARLENASHTAAVTRAMSYTEKADRFSDLTSGVAYSDFLSGASKLVKEPVHKKRFLNSLRAVGKKLGELSFEPVLAGGEELLYEMRKALPKAGKKTERAAAKTRVTPVSLLNEGLMTVSQVNYVARAGRYLKKGEKPSGAADVLRMILSYDYLWLNLRVKGGAYGCMCGLTKTGKGYLVSYRDPGLESTLEIYEGIPEYLENIDLSEDDMRKYIIGTIAGMDAPVTASVKASKELIYYYAGIDSGELRQYRDDVLSCTQEKIRGFAPNMRRLLSSGNLCVIGNGEDIKSSGGVFNSVREFL